MREGLVIAGWDELDDISDCTTRDQMRARVTEAYPEGPNGRIANWTGQLWRFAQEMRPGDLVVIPLKTRTDQIAIGRVTGRYLYRADAPEGFRHVRPVRWTRTDVPRSDARQDLLHSMGSLLTICALERHGAARRIAVLEAGRPDPGPLPEEVAGDSTPYELLDQAGDTLHGKPLRMSIREMLGEWNASRRTPSVVAKIEADLASKGLTTRPAFTDSWIDTMVELVPLGVEPTGDEPVTDNEADLVDAEELAPLTVVVGSLASANRTVVSVSPTDSLRAATTKMLGQNYSQLAVIDEHGGFHGAVTWESIAKAQLTRNEPALLDARIWAPPVGYQDDLLSHFSLISAQGFVFVQSTDRKTIVGIVTAADLNAEFETRVRPIAKLEEAERRLRRRVGEVVTVAELQRFRRGRPINTVADLTLGQYAYVLDQHFDRLTWPLDKDTVIGQLRAVCDIRNDLMHFTPDPLDATQLNNLDGFVNLLRTVDPRP
ncbi:CBS domain-containing protein [Longispora fulva]|uniref:CBS domain-containing protein n=1 Tax=Longispora fulva TaxID=619741 RepID=UPI0036DE3DDE